MTINGKFCHLDESGELVSIHSDKDWMPSEIKNVLKVDQLPVVYFHETSPMDIVRDCQQSFHVGLTLIRKEEDKKLLEDKKHTKVLLSCLTTQREIYVLNLRDLRQSKVLEELSKCDVRFYCIKGERIHFRLKENGCADLEYLINMTALDIFFSMRKRAIELKGIQKDYNLVNLSESSLPFHDKYDIIQEWLGVSIQRKSNKEERLDSKLIWDEPYGAAARNVIRFRCWFTRALGFRMSEAYRKQVLSCGNRLYDFALLDDANYDCFRPLIDSDNLTYTSVLGALNQCAELSNS